MVFVIMLSLAAGGGGFERYYILSQPRGALVVGRTGTLEQACHRTNNTSSTIH
ncbi:hypothetical protein PR003_g19749 [Phytophthora rubi]|uniref:Pectate lyase n=1 Tax=Phytophthora rubi TaxID=129364 RepID=A0A6A4DQ99_9STRA|nr:hypothetical protein PR003_g19749 [Phytophthora rubi]